MCFPVRLSENGASGLLVGDFAMMQEGEMKELNLIVIHMGGGVSVGAHDHGKVVDVKVSYPNDYVKQMLEYSRDYSFLPNLN